MGATDYPQSSLLQAARPRLDGGSKMVGSAITSWSMDQCGDLPNAGCVLPLMSMSISPPSVFASIPRRGLAQKPPRYPGENSLVSLRRPSAGLRSGEPGSSGSVALSIT